MITRYIDVVEGAQNTFNEGPRIRSITVRNESMFYGLVQLGANGIPTTGQAADRVVGPYSENTFSVYQGSIGLYFTANPVLGDTTRQLVSPPIEGKATLLFHTARLPESSCTLANAPISTGEGSAGEYLPYGVMGQTADVLGATALTAFDVSGWKSLGVYVLNNTDRACRVRVNINNAVGPASLDERNNIFCQAYRARYVEIPLPYVLTNVGATRLCTPTIYIPSTGPPLTSGSITVRPVLKAGGGQRSDFDHQGAFITQWVTFNGAPPFNQTIKQGPFYLFSARARALALPGLANQNCELVIGDVPYTLTQRQLDAKTFVTAVDEWATYMRWDAGAGESAVWVESDEALYFRNTGAAGALGNTVVVYDWML